MNVQTKSKIAIAELIGTFLMVLAGTGSIVIHDVFPNSVDHLSISIAFGASVMVVIFTIGEISGAHINPAVTLGFWASGRLKAGMISLYLFSQLLGAILASFLLFIAFPEAKFYGDTLTQGLPMRAFFTEVVLSFFLMFVIINVATGQKEKGLMAGIAIGTTVGICALVGGPLSGASMNPARSIGPAIFSGHFTDLWIYILAPILGAFFAIVIWKILKKDS